MPVAKEIKYITGVCCGAGSECIAHLWQKIALKTASAWSVWNPCLIVSITKAFMLLFLLEKDFIYFEINPRLPNCTVCFQSQHMRALHRGHIVEGLGEHTLLRSWARIAKESTCDQPQGSRGAASVRLIQHALILQGLWMWGYLGSTVTLHYRAMAPPQPWAMGAVSLVHWRTSCQAMPGTRDHRMGCEALPCTGGAVLRWVTAGLESDEGISAWTSVTQ